MNGKPFSQLPLWYRVFIVMGGLLLTSYFVVALYGHLFLDRLLG